MSDNFGFLCGKKSIFFCGIGGASMSGLAAICSLNGFSVSGSDCDISSDTLSFLQSYGMHLFAEGYFHGLLRDINNILYSSF